MMKNLLIACLITLIKGNKCHAKPYPTETAMPYITLENSQFGPNIEGASINHLGQVFASGYGQDLFYRIGRVTIPQEQFYEDDLTNSYLNGVRFANSTVIYAADMTNHRVLKLTLNKDGKLVERGVLCSDPTMIQPNDIALGKDGAVFVSGFKSTPTTDDESGDVWVCAPDQPTKRLLLMGRTNGIEVSNDNRYLYVSQAYDKDSESISQKIWKFEINSDLTLSNKQLFVDFSKLDQTENINIDGMRFDTQENLYVARYGGQHVTILNSNGQIVKKINLSFTYPTNLEFGGKDGKELHIVGRCGINTPFGVGKGCVDKIDVPYPGRAFTNLQRLI